MEDRNEEEGYSDGGEPKEGGSMEYTEEDNIGNTEGQDKGGSSDESDEELLAACPKCGKRYSTIEEVKEHIKKEHKKVRNMETEGCGAVDREGILKCPEKYCNRMFEDKDRMKRHINKCHKNTKESAKTAAVPLGQGTPCPKCKVTFSKASNVRAHLIKVHKLSVNEVSNLIIKQTKKLCPRCDKAFGNLYKHLRSCKEPERVTDVYEETVEEERPLEFEKGGHIIMDKYAKFLDSQISLVKNTKDRYRPMMKRILDFWERDMTGFKADSLLYACDMDMVMPDLDPFLDSGLSPSTKLTACKAYKLFATMMTKHIRKHYMNDAKNAMKRDRFVAEAYQLREEVSALNKPLNVEAELITSRNNAARQDDDTDWHFHQEKLMRVTKHIINHKQLCKLKSDVLHMSEAHLLDAYEEYDVRRGLMLLLLVSGNGARQHVIENMTISEFQNGKEIDGEFSVAVWKHKTRRKGPALLGFFFGLREAVARYLLVWKQFEPKEREVFATYGEETTKMKVVMEWMKKNVKNSFAIQNQKNLSAKSWRKAWCEWSKDADLQEMAATIMHHSKKVQEKFYLNLPRKNLAQMGRKVLGNVLDKDNISSSEDEMEDSNEVQEEMEIQKEKDSDSCSDNEGSNKEDTGSEDDNVEAAQLSAPKRVFSTRITREQKAKIVEAVSINGKIPTLKDNTMFEKAIRKSQWFREFYAALEDSHGKATARRKIRDMLRTMEGSRKH